MLFGSWSRYCITYKVGQVGFYIHCRKHEHMFYSKVLDYDESDRRGISLNSLNQFIVAYDQKIEFYCQKTLQHLKSYYIPEIKPHI